MTFMLMVFIGFLRKKDLLITLAWYYAELEKTIIHLHSRIRTLGHLNSIMHLPQGQDKQKKVKKKKEVKKKVKKKKRN